MDIHEHEMEHTHLEINKYSEAIGKFSTLPSDEEVSTIVNSLINRHFKENFVPDVLKHIHGCIDLTALTSLDTKESVWKMVDKFVNDREGVRPDVDNVAAICVYPLFVNTVKQALTAKDVKIASVAGGFPASQTFTEIKVAETAMAVMDGADEIDVVMNLGYFLEGDYETLVDELSEVKDSCRHAKMKVILETGALAYTENIRKATILAVYSGADFVKTSTGKNYPGASPEAVYAMCRVVKQYAGLTGRRVGIKVAGGVRTAEDAVRYYTIVKEVLGKEWTTKELFRIGASSLIEELDSLIIDS
ncbi:MAG: deoxyribose-phosphate aldolase [Tannerella sp.]|jgi:deoxyribose-phosphate aldolase|nr:deoxyribose-phosphate aldolase [Tannerella sp.]